MLHGESEVNDVRRIRSVSQDVAWAQVAVHISCFMNLVQRLEEYLSMRSLDFPNTEESWLENQMSGNSTCCFLVLDQSRNILHIRQVLQNGGFGLEAVIIILERKKIRWSVHNRKKCVFFHLPLLPDISTLTTKRWTPDVQRPSKTVEVRPQLMTSVSSPPSTTGGVNAPKSLSVILTNCVSWDQPV